ncbi:hypothetical protein [Nitrospirillum iridis]|uniref:Uncharacterized protein n=1 Tax=Nitrospirillum iridis TaxID=765888 RepID=A0A7X0EFG8_9PROT|nr:hypothetical protein [Nitrospirillum iridis]MBB6253036.1 hypothetical protein [Nitrospirillum iridis]
MPKRVRPFLPEPLQDHPTVFVNLYADGTVGQPWNYRISAQLEPLRLQRRRVAVLRIIPKDP